ncbi:hypothetical protein Cgig2_026379 [Carnegiea gigantea]|uniref:Uncharacterized protein n=1 Tax=Carnegiea gigantea TaxID=171969 RepID=A0A9Q1Q6S3_9CARY|nr:hypothetical protein Cgig2_026379 [Carnegiea gigantea]
MATKMTCAGSDPCEGSVDPEVLRGYIVVPFLVMELELLNNVKSRFKGLWPNRKLEEDLKECMIKLVPANWLRGLINVVPKAGAGDKSGRYCIDNLTMDMFTELLQRWQQTYSKLCWMPVILHNKAHISGKIRDSFKLAPHADLRYVVINYYSNWGHIYGLLMHMLSNVEDCRPSCYCRKQLRVIGYYFERIYVSIASLYTICYQMQQTRTGRHLWIALIALVLVSVQSNTYVDAAQWEVVTPECLEQRKYYFDQDCAPHYRDKYLLSFIQGRITHFPQHIRGWFPTFPIFSPTIWVTQLVGGWLSVAGLGSS